MGFMWGFLQLCDQHFAFSKRNSASHAAIAVWWTTDQSQDSQCTRGMEDITCRYVYKQEF